MIILPAIDLYDKKAVRLYKGDYDQMTVYDEHPVSLFSFYTSPSLQMILISGVSRFQPLPLEIAFHSSTVPSK